MNTISLSPVTEAARPQFEPYRTNIKNAIKAADKLERRIERALSEGNGVKAHALKRKLLSSRSGKVAALIKENRATPPDNRQKLRNIIGPHGR